MKSRITNANVQAAIDHAVGAALTLIEETVIEKTAPAQREERVVQLLKQILTHEYDEKNTSEECRSVSDILAHRHPQNRSLTNENVDAFLKNNMSLYDAITLFQEQLADPEKTYSVMRIVYVLSKKGITIASEVIASFLTYPPTELDSTLRLSRFASLAAIEQKVLTMIFKKAIYEGYTISYAVYRRDASKPIDINNINREPLGLLGVSQFDTNEQKTTAEDIKDEVTRMVTEKIAKWQEFIELKEAFKALTPPATNALQLVTQMKACAMENISGLSAAKGLTPLHVAVAAGSKELVAWCIERNIDPNAAVRIDYTNEIRQNMTAFTLAGSKENHSELTSLLNIPALRIAAQEMFRELTIDRLLSGTSGKECLAALRSCKAAISGLKTVESFSVLHVAVMAGTVEEVRWCLQSPGSDINIKNAYGHTPLFYAKNEAIANALISSGASVDIKTPDNITVLHYLIDSNCAIKVIRAIIHHTRNKINIQDNEGHTPLYHAIKYQHYEAAQLLLLKYGVSIDVGKEKELAKKLGNQQFIQLFDAHAARQEFSKLILEDTNDKIVSTLNALKPHLTTEMIPQLITTTNGLSLLHMAAMVGHLELVEICLNAGVNKDTLCQTWGSTPLMFFLQRVPAPEDSKAVESIARLLLKSGNEINYTNTHRSTALHFAVIAKKLPLVRILLNYPQIDIHIPNAEGETASTIASTSSHPGICRLFAMQTKKADEKPSTKTLHDLAEKGDRDGIEKTLQANRELLNVKDDQGNTALHLAIMMEHTEATELLLSYGSSHQINRNGESAYDMAVAIGNPELLALFKEQHQAVENVKQLTSTETPDNIKKCLDAIFPYFTAKMMRTLKTNQQELSLLHLALIAGDAQTAGRCFNLKANKNAPDKFGVTPLMVFACERFESSGTVQTMIPLLVNDKHVDLNAIQNSGLTTLHFAVHRKDLSLVRALLIAGARTDIESTLDWSEGDRVIPAKSTACGKNQTDPGILYLFDKYKMKSTVTDEKPSPETLLHDLAEIGDTKGIKEMLEKNPALLNAKDKQGNTPLHVAVMMRQVKVVSELLLFFPDEIDLYHRNNKGETPYAIAYLTKNEQLRALFPLHEDVMSYENLHSKSNTMDIQQAVENIMNHAEDLGDFVYSLVTKDNKWTLLHCAILIRNFPLIKLCMEQVEKGKINLNAEDKDGRIAQSYGDKDITLYMANVKVYSMKPTQYEPRVFRMTPLVSPSKENKSEVSQISSPKEIKKHARQ